MFIVKIFVCLVVLLVIFVVAYSIGKHCAIKGLEKYHLELTNSLRLERMRLGLANGWIGLWYKDISIADFLQENEMSSVAIYGYGMQGKVLEKEMITHGIEPVCVIDQKAKEIACKNNILTLEDELPSFDALIITAAGVEKKDIINKIENKNFEILLLREIIEQLENR